MTCFLSCPFFSLRPINVSCVLKGGVGKREGWSSEELAAGDESRLLTKLADRHSPLEALFDSSSGAEPSIPIDDTPTSTLPETIAVTLSMDCSPPGNVKANKYRRFSAAGPSGGDGSS
jgi:hypothetical protein